MQTDIQYGLLLSKIHIQYWRLVNDWNGLWRAPSLSTSAKSVSSPSPINSIKSVNSIKLLKSGQLSPTVKMKDEC